MFYIEKSSFNNTLSFIRDNSKSGSVLLLEAFNFEKGDSFMDIYSKAYHLISSVMFDLLFNEPLTEITYKRDLYDILKSHKFIAEDVYELNDCYKDDHYLYKFKHLSPVRTAHWITITNKLVK